MAKAKLVMVQAEDVKFAQGFGWFAYYDAELVLPEPDEDEEAVEGFQTEVELAVKASGSQHGVDWCLDEDHPEEVPNELSRRAGLRRYYVAGL